MNTLGIDLSSRAIELVLLDENDDTASWTRISLEGATAFDRARDVTDKMPAHGWYLDNGVYLIAIERPFVTRGQDVIRLVQGAVLASLPRELPVWEVSVSQWKKALGIPIREKPSWSAFASAFFDDYWPQDARDALGVALYARDMNADGIAVALGLCPVCGDKVINKGAHLEACRGEAA